MDSIKAPWTPQQVAALNRFQEYGFVQEYTCPNIHSAPCPCVGHGDVPPKPNCPHCLGSGRVLGDRTLLATTNGWICPHCDYKQDNAHPMMLKPWIGPPSWTCAECGLEAPDQSPLHIGICSKCGTS